MKIEGKKIAGEVMGRIKEGMDSRFCGNDKPLVLAVVYVGENPASEAFIKQKRKAAEELGVDFKIYRFGGEISNEKLREEVGRIAGQGVVGGVIVQLPLPERFNRQKILNAVPVEKDVDVLSEKAWGAFSLGRSKILPPAVAVVEEILSAFHFRLSTSCVGVVGAGTLVGKPMAVWFTGKVKQLTVFDEGSDLAELKDCDLVVTGVGKAGIIKPDYLKTGGGVIDFGYDSKGSPSTSSGYNSKRVIGDLDASDESKLEKLAFWTPTPGGTGPILVAKLFENFCKLKWN